MRGDGEISSSEFISFLNHHKSFNSSTFREHDIEEDDDDDEVQEPENEGEGVQELGVICMQIRAYFKEKDETSGLEKFMSDVLSCVTDKTQGNEDGTCEECLFLGTLVKSGLKAKLNGSSLSLLQRAFCVDETFSSVRAVNFVNWLKAAGIGEEFASVENPEIQNVIADESAFEDRELIFNMITVEGSALKLKSTHTLKICVIIGDQSYVASVFPAKERGTEKRTFKLDWKPIQVTAEAFRTQKEATVTMTASGSQNCEEMFEVADTVVLTKFMVAIKAAFEVSIVLTVPRLPGDGIDSAVNSQKSNSENSYAQEVRLTLIGTAREATLAAMRRISLMKTEDLIRVTFDPLPADDDFSSPSSSTCTSPTHASSDKHMASGMKNDGKTQEDLDMIDEDEDQSSDDVLPTAATATPQSEEQSDMAESISTDGSEKGQPLRQASTKNISSSDNVQRRNRATARKQPVAAAVSIQKASVRVEEEDEEEVDYDMDFSPDSVSMTPDAPLTPLRRERPKSAVKDQKKIATPVKSAEKVVAVPKKVEIMVDSNDYEDDEYEVDFE